MRLVYGNAATFNIESVLFSQRLSCEENDNRAK